MPQQYVSNNVSTLPHSRTVVNPFGRRTPIQLQYYNNIYEYSQSHLLCEESLHNPLRHTISSLPFMATGINGQETGITHRHLPLPTDNEKQSMHLDQYPW